MVTGPGTGNMREFTHGHLFSTVPGGNVSCEDASSLVHQEKLQATILNPNVKHTVCEGESFWAGKGLQFCLLGILDSPLTLVDTALAYTGGQSCH